MYMKRRLLLPPRLRVGAIAQRPFPALAHETFEVDLLCFLRSVTAVAGAAADSAATIVRYSARRCNPRRELFPRTTCRWATCLICRVLSSFVPRLPGDVLHNLLAESAVVG